MSMGGGYRLGKCSATKFYSHSRSVAHLFLFRIDKLVRVGLEMLGIQDLDWAKDAELYQARVVRHSHRFTAESMISYRGLCCTRPKR